MPRSLKEILDHADELSARFTNTEPDLRDAAPMRAIRDAVTERAGTERCFAGAVTAARTTGASGSAIGCMLAPPTRQPASATADSTSSQPEVIGSGSTRGLRFRRQRTSFLA